MFLNQLLILVCCCCLVVNALADNSKNLAFKKPAKTSSVFHPLYDGPKAVDGDVVNTRWATTSEDKGPWWLEVDFGQNMTFNKTVINEKSFDNLIEYQIQYFSDGVWKTAYTGIDPDEIQTDIFEPVTGSKVRLYILKSKNNPTIWEFAVYNHPDAKISPQKLAKVNLNIKSELVIKPKVSQKGLVKAEIKNYKGLSVLHIDGKPVSPTFFFANTLQALLKNASKNDLYKGWKKDRLPLYNKQYKLLAKNELHLYEVESNLAWQLREDSPKRRFYDIEGLVPNVNEVLKYDPNAKIIVRCNLGPLLWYSKKKPEEEILYAKGEVIKGHRHPANLHNIAFSYASEYWQKIAGDSLRGMIQLVNKSPFANNIIGYHFTYLAGGENFYHPANGLADYGIPMQKKFREFVIDRYKTPIALSKAWGKKMIFDDIRIPSYAQRTAAKNSTFLVGNQSSQVFDFLQCLNETTADMLDYMGKIVKEETDNRCLSIAFYGYINELPVNFATHGVQNSGHMAISKAIKSKYIDIFAAPRSYYNRGEGGSSLAMTPVDSYSINNKLWITEDDTRTSISASSNGYNRNKDLASTIRTVRRTFASIISHGNGLWWMDLPGNGWWADETLMQEMAKLKDIYDYWLKEAKSCAYKPDIAFIVDDKSSYSLSSHSAIYYNLMSLSREGIDLMGMQTGQYLLSDLTAGKVPDCKMYVFLTAFDMSNATRKYINNNLKKDGKVLIWFYGNGYLNNGIASLDNISSLIGIKMAEYNSSKLPLMKFKPSSMHPLVHNLAEKSKDYGNLKRRNSLQEQIKPLFYSADKKAVVLGSLDSEKAPAGKNLVFKKNAQTSSVFHPLYDGPKAVDGDVVNTRWATTSEDKGPWWLEVDFGQNMTFNKTVINEKSFDNLIEYQIQYFSDGVWKTAYTGIDPDEIQTDIFEPVTGSKVRLYILKSKNNPTIWEFAVFNDPDVNVSKSNIEQGLFAYKPMKNWHSIYIGVPYFSKEIIRNIAKYFKVHIYSDKNVRIYTNNNLLCVYNPNKTQNVKIKLPEAKTLIDLDSKTVIAKNVKEFICPASYDETKFYFLK